MRNLEAVARAAAICGAKIIGKGSHRLYGGQENGYALTLKGWTYPLVVHEDGSISYDNYEGRWGAESELTQFKEEYSMSCVAAECANLGWMTEPQPDGLLIFHPEGGTIKVERNGTMEAFGFSGGGCATATEQIERVLGSRVSQNVKPEFHEERIEQQNNIA